MSFVVVMLSIFPVPAIREVTSSPVPSCLEKKQTSKLFRALTWLGKLVAQKHDENLYHLFLFLPAKMILHLLKLDKSAQFLEII